MVHNMHLPLLAGRGVILTVQVQVHATLFGHRLSTQEMKPKLTTVQTEIHLYYFVLSK